MQWINCAPAQATLKTAPPNGYRRKDACLSFLTKPDLWVVSVEKTNCFYFFVTNIAKFALSATTYGSSWFSNEV